MIWNRYEFSNVNIHKFGSITCEPSQVIDFSFNLIHCVFYTSEIKKDN